MNCGIRTDRFAPLLLLLLLLRLLLLLPLRAEAILRVNYRRLTFAPITSQKPDTDRDRNLFALRPAPRP